eukprot:PhM_4_TR183/c0_g1_i1/m.16687
MSSFRPSTSPDISLVNNVAINRAKAMGVVFAANNNNSSSSSSSSPATLSIQSVLKPGTTVQSSWPRPPMHRQQNQAKLNPLAVSIPGGGGGGGPQFAFGSGGMMIEGSKTGEEKTVSGIERRQSISTPGTDSAAAAARRDNIHTKDQQKIRRLEADVKRLQEQLKAKEDEALALSGEVARQRELVSGMETERDKSVAASATDQQRRQAEADALRQKIAQLQSNMDAVVREQAAKRKELEDSLLARIDQEKRNLELERDRNKAQFKQRDDELRADATKWKSEVDVLTQQINKLKNESDRNLSQMGSEASAARKLEDSLRSEIRELRGEIVGQQASVEEAQRMSRAFYDYMVSICQPQFTVVKDEGLTPVETTGSNSNAQAAEGFVLVPLRLLLEGYALLPTDRKKKIADDYADDVRSGRVPNASAGTFAVGKIELPSGSAHNAVRRPSNA